MWLSASALSFIVLLALIDQHEHTMRDAKAKDNNARPEGGYDTSRHIGREAG